MCLLLPSTPSGHLGKSTGRALGGGAPGVLEGVVVRRQQLTAPPATGTGGIMGSWVGESAGVPLSDPQWRSLGRPPQRLQFLRGAGPLWLWSGKGTWTSLTLASSHIHFALSPENVVSCPDWTLTKVS